MSELSKQTMSDEDYFEQVSNALASKDPERISAVLKQDVEITGKSPNTGEELAPKVVEEEEIPLDEEEEEKAGEEESEPEEEKKEVEVRDQPFRETGEQKPSKESSPAKQDGAKETKPPKTPSSADAVRGHLSGMTEDARKATTSLMGESTKLRKELEQVVSERDNYKHRFDSNAGRITAFQKTIADLKNQIALLESVKQPPLSQRAAGKSGGGGGNIRNNPRLKELAEADPKLAEIIGGLIEDSRDELLQRQDSSFRETAEQSLQRERAAFATEQNKIVREYVDNLDDVIDSPEFDYYCKNVASKHVKDLLGSIHAEDSIDGLRLYNSWLDSVEDEEEPEETASTTAAQSKGSEERERAQKVIEARDRRLKAKDVSGGSTATPQGGGQLTDAQLFDQTVNATLKNILPKR